MHNLEEETAELSEKAFRQVLVKKFNAISNAITALDKKMQEFQTITLDALKNEIYGKMRSNEQVLKDKIDKVEMDYKIFKAKMAGGVVALMAGLEIVKRLI